MAEPIGSSAHVRIKICGLTSLDDALAAVDLGARPAFAVVRSLADLPSYHLTGGPDLLDPQTACETLAALLPPS